MTSDNNKNDDKKLSAENSNQNTQPPNIPTLESTSKKQPVQSEQAKSSVKITPEATPPEGVAGKEKVSDSKGSDLKTSRQQAQDSKTQASKAQGKKTQQQKVGTQHSPQQKTAPGKKEGDVKLPESQSSKPKAVPGSPSQGQASAEKPAQEKPTESIPPEAPSAKDKTAKSKPSKDKPGGPKNPKTDKPRRGGKLAVFIALLSLAGVAGGGYYGWLHLQDHTAAVNDLQQKWDEKLEAQRQDVAADFQSGLSSLTGLQNKIEQQNNQLGEQAELLSRLQLQATSQGKRLRSLSTSSREDWLLAEAEYLLRLANQRLLTERATQNSLGLIETADDILKDFHAPDLFAVRQQLAKDIVNLRVAESVDREGIFLQLNALASLIPDLTLLIEHQASKSADVVVVEAEQNWLDLAKHSVIRVVSEFGNVVRIVDRSEPVEPLLGTQEESLIRQNMVFMLEQAQLALLQENEVVYRTSLEKCGQWISRYFHMNPKSKVLVEQVNTLSAMKVTQELPDISGSLEALRDYINLWHLRHEDAVKLKEERQISEDEKVEIDPVIDGGTSQTVSDQASPALASSSELDSARVASLSAQQTMSEETQPAGETLL